MFVIPSDFKASLSWILSSLLYWNFLLLIGIVLSSIFFNMYDYLLEIIPGLMTCIVYNLLFTSYYYFYIFVSIVKVNTPTVVYERQRNQQCVLFYPYTHKSNRICACLCVCAFIQKISLTVFNILKTIYNVRLRINFLKCFSSWSQT